VDDRGRARAGVRPASSLRTGTTATRAPATVALPSPPACVGVLVMLLLLGLVWDLGRGVLLLVLHVPCVHYGPAPAVPVGEPDDIIVEPVEAGC
jgi:hypothetical protein